MKKTIKVDKVFLNGLLQEEGADNDYITDKKGNVKICGGKRKGDILVIERTETRKL